MMEPLFILLRSRVYCPEGNGELFRVRTMKALIAFTRIFEPHLDLDLRELVSHHVQMEYQFRGPWEQRGLYLYSGLGMQKKGEETHGRHVRGGNKLVFLIRGRVWAVYVLLQPLLISRDIVCEGLTGGGEARATEVGDSYHTRVFVANKVVA
jgi:hypothetical protein